MTTEKRQNPRPFAPTEGEVYENAGGGRYLCTRNWGGSEFSSFMNIASGWTLSAHGIVRYDDGTIEWDYSKGGCFNDGKLKEYKELCARTEKAEIFFRQRSLMNAMLCCMI